MRFNTIALIIVLTTSSLSLLFSEAYGEEVNWNDYANRADKASQDAEKKFIRIGDMLEKCGDYMVEKADARVKPSMNVIDSCMELAEGFNDSLSQYLITYSKQVEIAER
jgi:hypothetical protein